MMFVLKEKAAEAAFIVLLMFDCYLRDA
jgi:hypothetical protein